MKTDWTNTEEDITDILTKTKQMFSQSVGYYPTVMSVQEYKRLQQRLTNLNNRNAEQSQVISSPKV